jgi:hypothetical protein
LFHAICEEEKDGLEEEKKYLWVSNDGRTVFLRSERVVEMSERLKNSEEDEFDLGNLCPNFGRESERWKCWGYEWVGFL